MLGFDEFAGAVGAGLVVGGSGLLDVLDAVDVLTVG
jgi:hypothetical protein